MGAKVGTTGGAAPEVAAIAAAAEAAAADKIGVAVGGKVKATLDVL